MDTDRRWGDDGHDLWLAGDRDGLDRLVAEAERAGDEIALLITCAWRGDYGEVTGIL